jgi:uncharacterized RDD family membrane protein YckC
MKEKTAMTTTPDIFINQVLDRLPRAMARRDQIAMELRGHIAERTSAGHPLSEVLQQLGDPGTLADSYLSAEPLVSASFGQRVLAKLTDGAIFFVPIAAAVWLLFQQFQDVVQPGFWVPLAILGVIVGGTFIFAAYTILAEARVGQTIGKRLMDIRVVRESGARISVGQAMVRQIPMFLQMYWVDVLFALFTERSQRAFELLSKTRVVRNE